MSAVAERPKVKPKVESPYRVGDPCPMCGDTIREEMLYCGPSCKRPITERIILACRCLHPGDYMCNCGNPCWSLF